MTQTADADTAAKGTQHPDQPAHLGSAAQRGAHGVPDVPHNVHRRLFRDHLGWRKELHDIRVDVRRRNERGALPATGDRDPLQPVTQKRGARAQALAPRLLLFAFISLFTLGLGLLALFDGIAMLGDAFAGTGGGDRNVVLVLGGLMIVGALVPFALWFVAGWALLVRRDRWEW